MLLVCVWFSSVTVVCGSVRVLVCVALLNAGVCGPLMVLLCVVVLPMTWHACMQEHEFTQEMERLQDSSAVAAEELERECREVCVCVCVCVCV